MIATNYIAWQPGYQNRVDPEVAHNELNRIGHKYNAKGKKQISAELLKEESRPKDAALHPEIFDRDTESAAETYYLQRAKDVLRNLIVVEEVAGQSIKTRQWITVETSRNEKDTKTVHMYQPIEEALADPESRRFVLSRALAELVSCRQKYARLHELADVWEAIDRNR